MKELEDGEECYEMLSSGQCMAVAHRDLLQFLAHEHPGNGQANKMNSHSNRQHYLEAVSYK